MTNAEMKVLILFPVLLLGVPALAETYTWTGGGGVVNWSDSSKWKDSSAATGTAPGATDTVEFLAGNISSTSRADFTVTPPASFTGTIKAMGNSSSDDAGLSGLYFPASVKIVNTNGATFTVGGTGILIAYEGLAEMLDPAFTGVIDIPADVTLAPPADFATEASFMGVGVLKPSTAAQLSKAAAFRGTLDMRSLGAFEFGNDASLLMGRKLVLGSTTTSAPNKQTTTLAALDLSGTKWTCNSAISGTAGCVPSFDAAGTLTLPHVDGVRNKTSAFLNRRFKLDESFALRFKLSIAANTGVCGFGIVMRNGELTDVATGSSTTSDGAIPTNSYGISVLYKNSDGRTFNGFERVSGNKKFQQWGSSNSRDWQGKDAGFVLRNGAPIEVVASCHDRVLAVSMTQNGTTRTFRQSVLTAYGDSRGAMFGFFTHEDSGASGITALSVKVSDLEGWVASDQNGQWIEDANEDFTLTAANYNLYVDYYAGGVTNSYRGADALDAQGRLRVCEGMNWYGAAISKKKVSNRRFRLEWRDDLGSNSSYNDEMDIGFPSLSDSDVVSKYGDPDVADGKGYGQEARKCLKNGLPIKFCSSWYQNYYGLTERNGAATAAGHFTGTYINGGAYRTANTSNLGKWFYDGSGFHTVRFTNTSENNPRVFTVAGSLSSGSRRLAVVGSSASTYLQDWMGGIKMCYWNDAYVSPASLDVVVPSGAMTMGGIGSCAPLARVELDDATSRVAFTGSVAFGSALEIVVPEGFLKSVRSMTTLVDLSSAMVDGNLPATVKLVDAAGQDVDMHNRTLSVTSAGVTLSGAPGLILVFR